MLFKKNDSKKGTTILRSSKLNNVNEFELQKSVIMHKKEVKQRVCELLCKNKFQSFKKAETIT